jgi:hypothetical protein
MTQPLIKLMRVMMKIRCLFVDFVEMSLVGGEKNEFINVVCAKDKQVSRILGLSKGLEFIK